MKLQTLLLLLVLAVIAAFAALNWSAFIAPTTLSVGFATMQMPLGLVMLGLLIFVAVLFLVYVVYLQAGALLDTRRHAREVQANRELADQAEASRFTELRAFLDAELTKQSALHAESKSSLLARVDQLERDLHSLAEQTENALAAAIGELDERLERTGIRPSPR